jgi:hypothetical protein
MEERTGGFPLPEDAEFISKVIGIHCGKVHMPLHNSGLNAALTVWCLPAAKALPPCETQKARALSQTQLDGHLRMMVTSELGHKFHSQWH